VVGIELWPADVHERQRGIVRALRYSELLERRPSSEGIHRRVRVPVGEHEPGAGAHQHPLQLLGGRYIQVVAFQNSGAALAVNLWNISIVFLGPA
jgi:hypothetical protein